MIPQEKIGLLLFGGAEGLAGAGLIVILRNVAGIGIKITDLHENAVFIGDLLFRAQGQVQLVEVIVWPVAVLRTIRGIERITEIPELPILRGFLQPIAVGLIFRAGK